MSVRTHEIIQCPECKHEQEMEVYRSINTGLDPNLRRELFEGAINRFSCESCGHQSALAIPLLYNDPQREFCVHYYPLQMIKSEPFLSQFNRDATVNTAQTENSDIPEYMRKIQVVFDLNEMIHYILFREELFAHFLKNADDTRSNA